MTQKKSSTLQKKLYLFYSEDGFIDLTIGFVILFFALSLFANLSWLVGITGILPLLAWVLAKEKITRKRTGLINQNTAMKRRFSSFYIVMIVFGLLILALVITSVRSSVFIPLQYPLSMFGLILAMGISGLAVFLHTSRFFFHAAIIFIAMTLGEYLNTISHTIDTFILATLIAAIIILVIGFITTLRFLKTYPMIDTRMKK